MNRRFSLVPYILLTISGGCALVYEVTWARYLSLFLGHTTLAHMCVLAAFMGGLALGSILIGRMTLVLKRPLAAYGVIELLVGLYAIASPQVLGFGRSLMISASGGLPPGSVSLLALKLCVSIAVLLIPTFLMGGTFPVLMRYFQPESRSANDKSEWLYLVNSAGAVLGSLLAGFLLIPMIGLSSTLLLVGIANMLIGLCAVAVDRLELQQTSASVVADRQSDSPGRHPLAVPVYIAIGLSGLVSMIYELVWIRIFAVTLGSSTYSFTLMLAAFITGITLGSLAVGVIPRTRRNPLVTFAAAEIAIGLTVVLGLPYYERLPYYFWRCMALLSRTPESYAVLNLFKYSLCFAIMVVPTFFCGMTLPLAIKSVAHRDDRIGRDSGFVYGANTIGTLIGSLVTGLALIRFLGLRHSLEAGILLNIAAGTILLMASGIPRRRVFAGASLAAGVLLVVLMPAWQPLSFVTGTFRMTSAAPLSWKAYCDEMFAAKHLMFYKESDDGTVAVTQDPGTGMLTLYINGKVDASSLSDLPTQTLISQIPMLLHPDPRDVLVVGLGSGVSASSVLTHPEAKVDCVEISPAVVEAARVFSDSNDDIHENERCNIIVEDARAYAAMTRKKYDVVVSEPTNPWIAGVGNLFSREYYQDTARILKPDGIMAQWVQTYDLSDELFAGILRTMLTVYPYVYVFEAIPEDYVVLASMKPLTPDFRAMERTMQIGAVKEDLARVSINSLLDLLARQAYAPATARTMAALSPRINIDDQPYLEFQAPKCLFLGVRCEVFKTADGRKQDGRGLFAMDYLGGRPLTREQTKSLLGSIGGYGSRNKAFAFALASYYTEHWPDDPWVQSICAIMGGEFDRSGVAGAARAMGDSVTDGDLLAIQAVSVAEDLINRHTAFTPQDFRPAMKLLDRADAANPGDPTLTEIRRRVMGLTR